ncbi:MAG: hypothetical protein ACRC1H_14880, partial [Caldilineaceae bacterium]
MKRIHRNLIPLRAATSPTMRWGRSLGVLAALIAVVVLVAPLAGQDGPVYVPVIRNNPATPTATHTATPVATSIASATPSATAPPGSTA